MAVKKSAFNIDPCQKGRSLSLDRFYDNTPLLECIILASDSRWKESLRKFKNCWAFSLDVETTGSRDGFNNGLNWLDNQIRLIQVHVDDFVLIVDLFKDPDEQVNLFLHILKAKLVSERVLKTGQNLIFDLSCLFVHYGFLSRNIRDIKIMSIMRWCGIKAYAHTLAAIHQRLFNELLDKEEGKSDWWQPNLTNRQLNYAATDVIATHRCYLKLEEELARYEKMTDINGQKPRYTLRELVKLECDAIPAFVRMGCTGMPVNTIKGYRVLHKYRNALNDLNAQIKEQIGIDYSADTLLLAQALFNKTGSYPIVPLKKDEQINERTKKRMVNLEIEIPSGHKITTESANLFQQYLLNKEDLFLYIALARSLKKHIDTLCDLLDSSEQNRGYAHTVFSSLGFTGTGRSNSSSGGDKSSMQALNLQNLPNVLEHELLEKYELPPVRSIIEAPRGFQFSINDLSSSHLRIMSYYSGEEELLRTMSLPDPHLRTVEILLKQKGRDVDYEYCLANKKKDKEIAHYRKISKTFIYSLANVAGNNTIQKALAKEFVEASIDDVKEVRAVMEGLFPKLFEWQRYVHQRANQFIQEIRILLGKQSYKTRFAVFKTPEGRLIHLPAYSKQVNYPTPHTKYEVKISDVTSCMLLDKEANCVKKSLAQINHVMDVCMETANGWLNLVNFSHDEYVLLVNEWGWEKAEDCYSFWAENFTETLGHIPSGMSPYDGSFKKSLVSNYSEK